tara:strand:- start:80 stop:763 length:684 start_codon:yes stop_codon:yes gene_type:complete
MTNTFEDPKNYSFDHSDQRLKMIRDKINNISNLRFYKYKNNLGPSIELLNCVNKNYRLSNTYGIIDKNFISYKDELRNSDHIFFGKIKSYFSSSLNCQIITSVDSIDTDYGCWFEVNNFDNHIEMLKSFFGLKLIDQTKNTAKFKSIIINSSLSPFTLIIVKSKISTKYYNDDNGLSSLGWFANSFPQEPFKSFNLSDEFNLSLFTKKLKGRFIFDNYGISHELLKL